MSTPEDAWIRLSDVPSIADERWLYSANGNEEHEPSSWEPIDLSTLEDKPPIEPTLGGLGLAYPGKRHVFSGPQESAKTLLAYVLVIEVVRAGGKALIVDFEMGAYDARNRLRELGATSDELARIPFVEPWEPLHGVIVETLVEMKLDLVLVDAAAGAYDLQGLDDNKRGDVERFNALYVRPFWRTGSATIVLDHVVKNVEGRGSYAIGSERKVGGADVHLGFSVVRPIKRGAKGEYKITTHKDRNGYLKRGKLADLVLVSDEQTHAITWELRQAPEIDEEHPFRPTVKMEQASRWLEKQLEEDVSMSRIVEGIGGDRNAAFLAVNLLVEEGNFTERSGARNARLMTVARPYREATDDQYATGMHRSENEGHSDRYAGMPPLRGQTGTGGDDGDSYGSQSENDGIPF